MPTESGSSIIYDEIDRALTCVTVLHDLVIWREALADTFRLAEVSLSTPRSTDDL